LKNGLFVRLIFIIDHFSSPSEVGYVESWSDAGEPKGKSDKKIASWRQIGQADLLPIL
jgi:hypothetical protein